MKGGPIQITVSSRLRSILQVIAQKKNFTEGNVCRSAIEDLCVLMSWSFSKDKVNYEAINPEIKAIFMSILQQRVNISREESITRVILKDLVDRVNEGKRIKSD